MFQIPHGRAKSDGAEPVGRVDKSDRAVGHVHWCRRAGATQLNRKLRTSKPRKCQSATQDEFVAGFVAKAEGSDAVTLQPAEGDLEEAACLGRVIFDGIRAGSIRKVC